MAPVPGLFDDLPVLAAAPVDPGLADAWGVNPTVEAAAEPVSAVALGADARSFERVRAALAAGRRPVPREVRVESFLAALAGPGDGSASVAIETFPAVERPGYDVVCLSIDPPAGGAREARLEVRFDPSAVIRYRLVGYEPLRVSPGAAEGGVLAARAVVLYEVRRVLGARVLGTVAFRGRDVSGAAVQVAVPLVVSEAPPSGEAVVARLAASFAERLRGSYWARGVRFGDLSARLEALPAETAGREVLREMLRQAAALGDDTVETLTDFDHLPVLRR